MSAACPLCQVVERIARGEHPSFIAELEESHAILGDNQGTIGWVTLILKEHADHLDMLPLDRQCRLFADVARVARAQREIFGPVRINYECLGNVVAHVHWHAIPRHANDPTPNATVWGWTPEQLKGRASDAERADLIRRIRTALGIR